MAVNEMHQDTRDLADRLIAVTHGDIISWSDLSAAIDVADVRRVRWRVAAAMRVALREAGAVFATLRGIGYRRVTIDRLGSDVGQSARARIKRTARRANATIGLGLAKANDVPNEARIRALREQSALGLIEFLARERHLPTVDPERMRPLRPQHVLRQTLESLGINP